MSTAMQKLNVDGDGLCLFRSVAQSMSHVDHGKILSESEETSQAQLLREACNAFLHDHPGLIIHSQEYLEDESHFTNSGRRKIEVGSRGFNVSQRRSNAPSNIVRAANARIRRTQWQLGTSVQWGDELDVSILSFILSREIQIFNARGSSTVSPAFPTTFTEKPIAIFHTPELHYDAYISKKAPNSSLLHVKKAKKAKKADDKYNNASESQQFEMNRSALNAVFSGNAVELERVLKRGVSPNVENISHTSALVGAAYYGYEDCLRILIKYRADLDMPNPKKKNRTALMIAALNGKLGCVKLLVDAGANTKLKDTKGDTALDLAIQEDNSDIVTYLRKRI